MAANLRADREYWVAESGKIAILNKILKTGHKSNDLRPVRQKSLPT
jgi:hypothetical protein